MVLNTMNKILESCVVLRSQECYPEGWHGSLVSKYVFV